MRKRIITPLSPENFKKLYHDESPFTNEKKDEKKNEKESYQRSNMRNEMKRAKKVQSNLEREVSPKRKRDVIHTNQEESRDSSSIEKNKKRTRAIEKERHVDDAGKGMGVVDKGEMKDRDSGTAEEEDSGSSGCKISPKRGLNLFPSVDEKLPMTTRCWSNSKSIRQFK